MLASSCLCQVSSGNVTYGHKSVVELQHGNHIRSRSSDCLIQRRLGLRLYRIVMMLVERKDDNCISKYAAWVVRMTWRNEAAPHFPGLARMTVVSCPKVVRHAAVGTLPTKVGSQVYLRRCSGSEIL